MGTVFNPATEERVLLRAYHVFGRNELRADTRIGSADVSSLHAVVRWRARAWSIADFSRNGTFVDGEALPPGQWRAVHPARIPANGRRVRRTPASQDREAMSRRDGGCPPWDAWSRRR